MIIAHNLPGLNTSNRLKTNEKQVSSAFEKLSSGLRISRAAHDAAGLAISEKMRAQIRGLSQAERNIHDGISLLQTAEGAMAESHEMLQRIRELSIQAATGSYSDEDRAHMQKEIDQLKVGLDRVAYDTEFNTMALLAGRYDKDKNEIALNSIKNYVQQITETGGITETYTYGGTDYASAVIDFSNLDSPDKVKELVGKGVHYTCCTCDKAYSIKFVDGTADTSRLDTYNPVMEIDVSLIANGVDLVNKIIEIAYGQAGFVFDPTAASVVDNWGDPTIGTDVPGSATEFVKHYSQLAADGAKLYVYDDRSYHHGQPWPLNGRGKFELNVYNGDGKEDLFLFLTVHTGSQADQNMTLEIPNLTLEQLLPDKVSVLTDQEANDSIDMVDKAISRVSGARATMGAYQNRLEHAYRNVANTGENLTSAESKIRDVDMAREMMTLTKHNILAQSTQTMLSHAYSTPQNILQLLG